MFELPFFTKTAISRKVRKAISYLVAERKFFNFFFAISCRNEFFIKTIGKNLHRCQQRLNSTLKYAIK